MMKLILSFLMFPAFLALILAGLCGGFYFCCHSLPLAGEYSFAGHILKAFLYSAIISLSTKFTVCSLKLIYILSI